MPPGRTVGVTNQAVEQKLAAILAADVAGYSALMGDDERATVATLDAYRDVFRDHVAAENGRVVDTAGDSVLAVFPSTVGAVRAALAIQADLKPRNEALPEHRRMHFRIGVNLGDVIEKSDGTVYGDGVNIAARLEGLAAPGGLTISGTTFDQIDGKLDITFESLGEKEVKNIAKPVRAYRAIIGSTPSRPKQVLSEAAKRPSIAVLAFENLSGDPDQEYFADGIAEDLITELSRLRWLQVTARNSSFS
jgi:adenylate cyclase